MSLANINIQPAQIFFYMGTVGVKEKARDFKLKDQNGKDTIALGISVDTAPSKRAWAESLGIRNTSLPSDFWPLSKK